MVVEILGELLLVLGELFGVARLRFFVGVQACEWLADGPQSFLSYQCMSGGAARGDVHLERSSLSLAGEHSEVVTHGADGGPLTAPGSTGVVPHVGGGYSALDHRAGVVVITVQSVEDPGRRIG